jgi:hypothetical protein
LEIIIASKGGITLEYLDKMPIPRILETEKMLGEILDKINKDIEKNARR